MFWRKAYQLFKSEEPLTTPEELKNFYVERTNSPVNNLITFLDMEDNSAKFLLAGHRGGGKTTELRRLEQHLNSKYTVIWIDTVTALDQYNIGYAEVAVLIGIKIFEKVIQREWGLKDDLLNDLLESLKTVVYQHEDAENTGLELPEIIKKLGLILKQGLTRKVTTTLNIRPQLSKIIERVNAIIEAAEKRNNQKLLIIVDGLDRHDQVTASEMFASPLLTQMSCHIIYTIPISLRYSQSFRQLMESFQKCLDLTNLPVFKCDENLCPTTIPNQPGREILNSVIHKRLASLGDAYKGLFHPDALELICEKSGGIMRDLVRLARTACEIGLQNKLNLIDLETAQEAVREIRKDYNLNDYHYHELDLIHRTGKLTMKTHVLPNKGQFIICDELLQNKFVLGYYDHSKKSWFDVNPILLEDLQRWQSRIG
ncbi:hypothetical protein FD724_39455 (plasmid) [Nostoc sp. C057]|nr:hypothetical protein FD724_39455 [Nostoc sp. C057]